MDMQKQYLKGAEPLYLEGNTKGLLLLHGGGGGTTWDMKEFAAIANKCGFSVWLPLLPGFGTKPSDLVDITIDDWLNEARKSIKCLLENCFSVTIVGHSIGGLIALVLAAEEKRISRVVTWGAPWKIKNRRLNLLPIINKLPIARRTIPKRIPVEKPARIKEMGWVGYEWLPASLGFIILTAIKKLHSSINRVECPVFIIQGTKDEVIDKNSAKNIFLGVTSPEREIWLIQEGEHALMQDSCKEELFKRTLDFINKKNNKT